MTTSESQPKLPEYRNRNRDIEHEENSDTYRYSEKKTNNSLKIVAGLAAVSVAAAAGAIMGPKIFRQDAPEVNYNPVATAPETPGIELIEAVQPPVNTAEAWSMDTDAYFNSTTPEQRVSLINPEVELDRFNLYNKMEDGITSDMDLGILALREQKPSDKRLYTSAQMLNDFSISIAHATLQSDKPSGEKVLGNAVDYLTPEYNDLAEGIEGGDDTEVTRSIFKPTESYANFSNETFMGIDISADETARLIKSKFVQQNGELTDENYRLFKIVGEAGNQAVMQVGVWDSNDIRIPVAISQSGLVASAS